MQLPLYVVFTNATGRHVVQCAGYKLMLMFLRIFCRRLKP